MRLRPTPGTVLGIVAVVLACAGSATAGSLITGAQIKNGSITGLDIKQGSVQRLDLAPNARPKAGTGRAGSQGSAGPPGPAGPKGDPGPPGSAVAYAHVAQDGTLDAARTKGVSKVTHPGSGEYCFFGVAGTPKSAVANVDALGQGDGAWAYTGVAPDTTAKYCPANADAEVNVVDSGQSNTDDAFYVVFN